MFLKNLKLLISCEKVENIERKIFSLATTIVLRRLKLLGLGFFVPNYLQLFCLFHFKF